MAITVENISVNWFANSSPPYDLDIPLSSGVISGDVMVMLSFYGHNSNNAMATPSGWDIQDQLRTHGTDVGARYLHTRMSDGADTDPVVNNWNNFTGGTGGIIINLRGVDSATPSAANYNNQGNDGAPVCLSATPIGSNALALAIWCGDDNDLTTGVGYPAGWTGIFMEETTAGQDIMAGAAYKIVSAASGDATFSTDVANEEWIGDMMIFEEAGPGIVMPKLIMPPYQPQPR